jgi:deoxyguanosine kinase
LDAFYQEPQRWAYTLQSYAFITRIIAQEEFASSSQNSCAILERSVFSDRYCFAKNGFEMGVMNALEWNVYQEWFSWLVERHVVMPHGFIYLRTDPEICYQRLLKRARSEEAAVPYDYLKKLHDKHEAWLINKEEIAPYAQAIPVLVLNCNNDFEYNEQEQYNHVEKIQGFITETSGLVFPVTTQQRMTL